MPFSISMFEDKELLFHDKGQGLPNGDEIPEAGGYQMLEKILSQYSTRTT